MTVRQDASESLLDDLQRMKPDELTLNGWAVLAGVNRAIWGDIRRHGNPSRKTLQKLLSAIGSSIAEFEALRIGAAPQDFPLVGERLADVDQRWRGPTDRRIPLFSSNLAGPLILADQEVSTFTRSPLPSGFLTVQSSLVRFTGLYAVALPSTSMEPRFRQHQALIVAPREDCNPGDDLLIQISAEVTGIESRWFAAHMLESRGMTLNLAQYRPPVSFELDRSIIISINKILGEHIA